MDRAIAVVMSLALLAAAVPSSVAATDPPSVTDASAAATDDVAAAEQAVLDAINAKRHKKGLRALRRDPRVANVARARSQDMIDRHYFGHKDPDGRYIGDHLRRAHIRFSRSSEIIAWTRSSDLIAEAAHVVDKWMSDAIHRHEVLSKTHNYFGAGIAASGSKVMWTVDSITGPDRTDPVARVTSAGGTPGAWAVTWKGSDPRLVVGTSGLGDYDVARRLPGGSWVTIRSHTTRTSTTSAGPDGTDFRVRARDKAGNHSDWSATVSAGD